MRRILLVAFIAVMGVFSFSGGGSSALAAGKNCIDFVSHEDAQAYFDANGGSPTNDVDGLDADHDGQACENFDYSGGNTDATSAPTIVPTDIVIVPTDVATAPTTAPGEPTTVPAVTPTTDPGATPVVSNPGNGVPAAPSQPGAGAAVSALPNTGAGSSSTDTGFVWLTLALSGVLGAGALAYRRSRA